MNASSDSIRDRPSMTVQRMGVGAIIERVAPWGWLVAGLACCTAIAVFDLVVGGETILISLLLVGPLLSAIGAGWRQTAIVMAYAVALSLPLGIFDGLFGSTDHIVRVLLVAGGGALAVWLARLREHVELERARIAFLAEAGLRLDGSLDYQTAAQTLASLAVPLLGDWCGVYVLEDGAIKQLAVAHEDPAKEALARDLERRYQFDPDLEMGVAKVSPSWRPRSPRIASPRPPTMPSTLVCFAVSVCARRSRCRCVREAGCSEHCSSRWRSPGVRSTTVQPS
jgi:hypothetical protein